MDSYLGLVFWGIACHEQDAPPWLDRAEERFADQWEARWRRLGGGELVVPCRVGVYGRLANFSFAYVAVSESEQRGSSLAPKPVQFPVASEAWRSSLKRFCERLEIAWREPQWQLVAIKED